MSQQQEISQGHEAFIFISGLIIGAIAGLSFGILAAPYSGSVTRRKLMRTAEEARDQVSEALDDIEESGKEFIHDVKRAAR